MISIIVTLIIIAVLLYCVDTLIPMDPTLRKIIRIVVFVGVALWLLEVFGLWNGFGGFHNTKLGTAEVVQIFS